MTHVVELTVLAVSAVPAAFFTLRNSDVNWLSWCFMPQGVLRRNNIHWRFCTWVLFTFPAFENSTWQMDKWETELPRWSQIFSPISYLSQSWLFTSNICISKGKIGNVYHNKSWFILMFCRIFTRLPTHIVLCPNFGSTPLILADVSLLMLLFLILPILLLLLLRKIIKPQILQILYLSTR